MLKQTFFNVCFVDEFKRKLGVGREVSGEGVEGTLCGEGNGDGSMGRISELRGGRPILGGI